MAKPNLDDLEAVRAVVEAIEGFDALAQERIIRWAREKLGLAVAPVTPAGSGHTLPASRESGISTPAATQHRGTDIRTFVASKNPQSDVHFAATVAYYYRFEAPVNDGREAITAEDLQEACRQVNRDRLKKPSQTLINAHQQGLLNKASERGSYSINTVGENLVAMALPTTSGAATGTSRSVRRRSPLKKREKARARTGREKTSKSR
jgi:hypothetical protein